LVLDAVSAGRIWASTAHAATIDACLVLVQDAVCAASEYAISARASTIDACLILVLDGVEAGRQRRRHTSTAKAATIDVFLVLVLDAVEAGSVWGRAVTVKVSRNNFHLKLLPSDTVSCGTAARQPNAIFALQVVGLVIERVSVPVSVYSNGSEPCWIRTAGYFC
jgi:hypothetical protein